MNPRRCSRRSALLLGSTALLAPLAGCAIPTFGRSQGITIGDIVIRHYPPESHTVRLELERDGETVLEETYADLSEGQKEIVEATWSPTPADYRLYTGVEGPLSTTDSQFDIFVHSFTSEDVPSDSSGCSVIDIQIGAPPNPGDVAIGLVEPGLDGLGTCG